MAKDKVEEIVNGPERVITSATWNAVKLLCKHIKAESNNAGLADLATSALDSLEFSPPVSAYGPARELITEVEKVLARFKP